MDYKFVGFKNNKGVALIIALLVLTVLIIYSAAFISASVSQNMTSDIFKRRAKAFNVAESGLDHAVLWLRAQSSPPVGNRTDPWGDAESIGGGIYSVAITDLGAIGGSGTIRRYKVTSVGTFGNMSRSLSAYVQVDNYARYIWFTDNETFSGTTVWFWTQDHLDGPTHTNGHFNIYGNPAFEGDVRSVDDYIRFYNNGHNTNLSQPTNSPYDIPSFTQGITFGTEPITMPSQALSLRAAAYNSGFFLSGDTSVVLNSNGTMNVTNSTKKWNNKNMSLPSNGALFVNKGNLTISGTLDGSLTVGSSRDIVIPNNILYADDPRTDPSSNDVLGIIAESDVVIDHNAPTNLEINGCVMAMNTSFMLEDYWVGPAKGTLSVYGGIIQNERGPVGTFNSSSGQKASGYSKNYSYDLRLLGSPPPFMPTTGDYVTLSWEEN